MSDRIMPSNEHPEVEVLLRCARTRVEPQGAERIRVLLREGIDWAYLVRMAFRHGTIPLLFRSLNTTCPHAVPGATLDQLRAHCHAVARSNLLLTRELIGLMESLGRHDIPVLPLKGPVLAEAAYGNLSLRQFSDLDILVHPEDVTGASDVLASRGFRPVASTLSEDERLYNRKACLLPDYHTGFLGGDGRVRVELHWNIVPEEFSTRLPDRLLWGRLQQVPFGDRQLPTLPPENLLLVLCLHGGKHLWESLKWIVDIAELIRARPDLDWREVMDAAKELGKERVLLLGLGLATEVVGAEIPTHVRSRIIADSVVRDLGRQVREWLFRDDSESISFSDRWNFYLRLRDWRADRLRQRVRYFLASFQPTQADRAMLPLPRSLSVLYYAIRPLRLLGKYSLRPFQRLLPTSDQPLRRAADTSRMTGTCPVPTTAATPEESSAAPP